MIVLLCPVSLPAQTAPTPSRAPEPGCTWKPFESSQLDIGLLVQSCSQKDLQYVFSAKGNWLTMRRPSDPATFNSPYIIQVFSKPADQPIEAAIRARFITNLKGEARESCQVRPLSPSPLNDKRKQVFEIVPTGAYKQRIMKELQQEPRDFGCGNHGKQQGSVYFEYHPEESQTTYLFVVFGMDAPLFDENSIEILKR
jgi:hypothetical protein